MFWCRIISTVLSPSASLFLLKMLCRKPDFHFEANFRKLGANRGRIFRNPIFLKNYGNSLFLPEMLKPRCQEGPIFQLSAAGSDSNTPPCSKVILSFAYWWVTLHDNRQVLPVRTINLVRLYVVYLFCFGNRPQSLSLAERRDPLQLQHRSIIIQTSHLYYHASRRK